MDTPPLQLHLVSHASGELVEMLARNAVAQLPDLPTARRLWKMVRRLDQLPDILAAIGESPGFVVHSLAVPELREALEAGCERLHVPCQFALEPLLGRLAAHTGRTPRFVASHVGTLDEDYYRRVEAMKFTLAHDDGLATDDLDDADVVIVGVSRATKTPTCMVLASRGIKAANVPLVPGIAPPESLLRARRPLVVGLTVDPSRLATVRTGRLQALQQDAPTDYTDPQRLRQEVREARRLFTLRRWPEIDVTNRSIEQTAAQIIAWLQQRRAGA